MVFRFGILELIFIKAAIHVGGCLCGMIVDMLSFFDHTPAYLITMMMSQFHSTTHNSFGIANELIVEILLWNGYH